MDSLDSLSCDLTRESSPGFRRRDKRSTRNENPGRDDTRGVRRVRGVRLIRGKMAMPAERNFDRGRLDECQSTMAILFTGLPMDLKDASRTSYRRFLTTKGLEPIFSIENKIGKYLQKLTPRQQDLNNTCPRSRSSQGASFCKYLFQNFQKEIGDTLKQIFE